MSRFNQSGLPAGESTSSDTSQPLQTTSGTISSLHQSGLSDKQQISMSAHGVSGDPVSKTEVEAAGTGKSTIGGKKGKNEAKEVGIAENSGGGLSESKRM